MTPELIRGCWAVVGPFSPSLRRIKAEGRWLDARPFILAEAEASLRGLEKVSILDHCHALEYAAERWLALLDAPEGKA